MACGHYMQCGTKRTVNVVAGPGGGGGQRNTSLAELPTRRAFGHLVVRTPPVAHWMRARIDCVVTAAREVPALRPPAFTSCQDGSQIAIAVIRSATG